MIAVFLEGKAVIEASFLLTERASPKPPPVSRRWSFYTALRFPSSTCAPEVWARHRWKSFGRDPAHNAGSWRAMADAFACKGMVVTADRSAD
ncbi:MAG: hypothetical protein DMG10_31080 [Acidobacteria bacterium]|nr:MAG: hypothetical protein DMG10_31080 [Acidobacteriota bacterium]